MKNKNELKDEAASVAGEELERQKTKVFADDYAKIVAKRREAAIKSRALVKQRKLDSRENKEVKHFAGVGAPKPTGKRGRPKGKKIGLLKADNRKKRIAEGLKTSTQTKKNFDDVFLRMICNMAKEGMELKKIAELVGVTVGTIRKYGNTYEDFYLAISQGRKIADTAVEMALFAKATGYVCKETRVFAKDGYITDIVDVDKHYPPDTEAIKFWLKNRKAEDWKEKTETVHSMGQTITSLEDARRIMIADIASDEILIDDVTPVGDE